MKPNAPMPRPMLWGGYAVILSSLSACPFALSMPSLALSVPAVLSGLLFITARLTGKNPAPILHECRHILRYGLIFNAVCFCAQMACSGIPGYLVQSGGMAKGMLTPLGHCNLLIHLFAVICLFAAAVHACAMLKKKVTVAPQSPHHPVCE